MATQTDTNIASITALLSAFAAFAVANAGFTDDGTDTVGGETLHRISRTTSTVLTYWGFVYDPVTSSSKEDERAAMRMMLSLPTSSNWNTIASGQKLFTRLGLYNFAAPYTGYKFYTDGTNVFAAVEVRSGIFTHFAIGNLTKCGTYDGGEFLQADYHKFSSSVFEDTHVAGSGSTDVSTYVFAPRRTDGEATTDARNYIRYNIGGGDETDFFPIGSGDDGASSACGSATLAPTFKSNKLGAGTASTSSCIADYFGNVINQSPSSATNVAPIMPVYVTKFDLATTSQFIIGYVPNIGSVSMGNLNPKDLVNTDWEVYPKAQKTGNDAEAAISDHWGIAYRII